MPLWVCVLMEWMLGCLRLMNSDLRASVLRAKMDMKLKNRQRKKDEQFLPDFKPEVIVYRKEVVAPTVEDYEPNDYELRVMGKIPTIDEI